jgi:hypothetical protein
MTEELHNKITNRTITATEVLSLENIEQRMVAMKFLGAEFVADNLPSQLIHSGKNGNELRKCVIDNREAFYLKYKCPSTEREYVSFVPINEAIDADAAMAWKFGLTKQQYINMELES